MRANNNKVEFHSKVSMIRYLGALAIVTSALAVPAFAAPAGEVEYAKGVGTILHRGLATRILGQGAALDQGDVVATGDNSYAIVKMTDGSRITVRPGSQMLIESYQYDPEAKEGERAGGMVLGLLKGGLRALTGLIPKRDTSAALIHTPVATVGIRGTDFDLRLCDSGCKKESVAEHQDVQQRNIIPASARIVALVGDVGATNAAGTHRLLANGGPIYPGDVIETGPRSYIVLVFRDETKMTIQPVTRFKIEDFVYDGAHPDEGRMFVNLLKGGMRAFTGLIGKIKHENVNVHTPTATVGIRGTGFDLQCVGTCAAEPPLPSGDGLAATVWDGSIDLVGGAGGTLTVGLGQTGLIGADGKPVAAPVTPLQFSTPRPDGVAADMEKLFGVQNLTEGQEGLYVVVRDGHVSLATADQVLDLGKGETGFTDGTVVLRPISVPTFLNRDPIPLPGTKISNSALLGLLKQGGVKYQCGP